MHESGELYHSQATSCRIFRRVFTPQSDDPAGAVLMLHGLGDHLGCHVLAAEMFCGRGWICAGVDWPGHGFSEGKRGHIDGVESAVALIAEACEFLRGEIDRDLPLCLYAHSTGALFALQYLGLNEQGAFGDPTGFDRIWLSSPLLRPDHGQNPLKTHGARLVAKFFPRLIFDTGVRPEECRHINVEKAKADGDYDLCHHLVSAALGADLLNYGTSTMATADVIRDPADILITQGDADLICPPRFSREFFKAIPANRKTYTLLPGMLHEPLREPENSAVVEAVENWLTN